MSLLIDGLDELPTGTTESFFSALKSFLNQSDTDIARVILTTRFDAFRMHEDQFTGWRRFSLQPLSMPQIEQCVSGWFTDENQRNNFLSHLGDRRLAELASRPFLLAMMCLVFRRGGALGTNRSDLYSRAISYLEGRHAEQTTERIVRIRREVMWEIAFRSLQMGTLEVDKWTAAGLAAARVASIESSFPERFGEMVELLDAASHDVGILQSSMGRYSFIHRSFQEYMASQRLASTPDGEGILVEHAQISRWEEPIRLYVGSRRDATSQARVLRSLWGVNQALALRALTDATMLPSGFARDLLRTSSPLERVRMLAALKESLRDIDPTTRLRIALETALPLLREDSDSQVLYNAIEVVRWVDAADNEKTLWNVFGAKARQLREILVSDPTSQCEFIPLPGGVFQMGDDDAVDEIERPSHPVEVQPFEIMRFQLTNRAYEIITGRSADERPSVATDDKHPVVEMNWFDAYIAAFRIGCRLPTEAEWEYAARSGSTTAWCFGDDESMLHEYANYEGNAQFHGRPWIVGSGKPNAFGLYDMHGNVWEWCIDWLAPYTSDPVPADNSMGPPTGDARIRRGGGHSYHARGCRSAFRWGNDPSYSYKDIGARFVIDETLVSKGW
jgi:formylglycine-generating enzyme required for sulfatase activity